MTGELFLKGLAFGFVLAATVGPMWVLCLRRTLAYGAAFGLTAVSGLLLAHRFWIGLAGAAFLLYLGIKALLAKPSTDRGEERGTGVPGAFLSTLGLTLTNPPTILAFAAIFAGLGLVSTANYAAAALIVLGVFLGSALWWLILAAGAGRLRSRIRPAHLRGVNVVSGLAILAFAAWQLGVLFG